MTPGHHARRRLLRGALAAIAGAALLPGCAGRPLAAQGDSILVVGDSLSAGYGLRPGTGWVALLERRLAAAGRTLPVVNASISGETTRTGRANIARLLDAHRPGIVVIELGADDIFTGLTLAETESNLEFMARAARQAGARVLMVGVRIPRRYGVAVDAAFFGIFPKVAGLNGAGLVPDLLARVDDAPNAEALFQRDRLHPNEQAQGMLLDNVWPELQKLLR